MFGLVAEGGEFKSLRVVVVWVSAMAFFGGCILVHIFLDGCVEKPIMRIRRFIVMDKEALSGGGREWGRELGSHL